LIQLSIIIINYKSAQLVIDCLNTVYAQTNGINFEVIVVDNDSHDGGRELILGQFPSVKWIDMSYNSGFARANNEGIRQSTGEAVLLLNADTLVEDNAIEKCFDLFSRSEYVACGVQLVNPDGSIQISGSYFMTGGLNNLLPLPYVGSIVKWAGNIFRVKPPSVETSQDYLEVDWVNGAFLMVKKTAIDKSGLMDEDFFLYAEEAEWCARLKKAGRICLYGKFRVIHLQGETANKVFRSKGKGYYNLYDRKGLQIMLSNFVRIRKQFGLVWFLINLLLYTIEIPIFFVGNMLSLFRIRSRPAFSWKNFAQYTSNVLFIWSELFNITSNKPHFYKVHV